MKRSFDPKFVTKATRETLNCSPWHVLKIKEHNIKSLVGILWKISVFTIKLISKVFCNNYKGLTVLDSPLHVSADTAPAWTRHARDSKSEEYPGKSRS